MRNWTKMAIGALLAFSVCVCGVGYAAVSETLEIGGSLQAKPQSGVFISDVDIPEGTNAVANNYTGTVLNSTVTLGNSNTSTVSFDISIFNNSEYVYKFNGVKYLEEAYSNADILFELNGLEHGDQITGHQFLDFTITFSYENSQAVSNKVLNSVLNFEFVPEDEYVAEVVVSDATTKFKEILNSAQDYQTLIDQMNTSSWGRLDTSYIGNVVGATSNDTLILEALFTEGEKTYLTLNIGGKETNITAMVKREDVDGKSTTGDGNGREMTIYMTASTIGRNPVQVFASVFTKEGNGEWYQLGQMYEGTASTNNYQWGNLGSEKNSFHTGTWASAVDYYGSGTGATIEEVIAAYLKTI